MTANPAGIAIVVLAFLQLVLTLIMINQRGLLDDQHQLIGRQLTVIEKQVKTIDDQRTVIEAATKTMRESTLLLKACGDQI